MSALTRALCDETTVTGIRRKAVLVNAELCETTEDGKPVDTQIASTTNEEFVLWPHAAFTEAFVELSQLAENWNALHGRYDHTLIDHDTVSRHGEDVAFEESLTACGQEIVDLLKRMVPSPAERAASAVAA
jgi:hypothetical protein